MSEEPKYVGMEFIPGVDDPLLADWKVRYKPTLWEQFCLMFVRSEEAYEAMQFSGDGTWYSCLIRTKLWKGRLYTISVKVGERLNLTADET